MRYRLFLVCICLAVSFFPACNKPENGVVSEQGFDKTAMLTYYADNVIIPAYADLQTKMKALDSAITQFVSNPNTTTQAQARAAYEAAHLNFEHVAAFQFGPAETALYDVFMNYSGGLDYNFTTAGELTGFSVDTTAIEGNIASGTYNLAVTTRSTLYSQGFPALNYLLFAPNAITAFQTNNANRVQYIKNVVARMQNLTQTVANGWGAYRAEFIANTKTNVGSPIGNMVNQLAYQLDMLKGPRIGWPLGKQSNNLVFATKVEAYYAGISIKLAVENLESLRKMYTAAGSGRGISDYLIALNKGALNTDVLAQFDATLLKLRLIPDPLSAALTTQPATVDAAYKEIQKLLTLIKTDVASATAVQITFMDNDGD